MIIFLEAEKIQIIFYEKNNKLEESFYILNEDVEDGDCHLSDKNDKHFYKFPFIGLSSEVVKNKKMLILNDNPRLEKN